MLKYIEETYPENCLANSVLNVAKQLPIKSSYSKSLSHLSKFKYPAKIEILEIRIHDLNFPFQHGWDNYQILFALCPKLKAVCFSTIKAGKGIDFYTIFDNLTPEKQNIWNQRISYLNSRGINVLTFAEFRNMRKKKTF
jgi:hypothetical protein